MNLLFKSLLCLLWLCGVTGTASASHIFGADFYYTHVSGNTYNVALDIYGDCSGASFPNLISSIPEVQIFNNGNFTNTINLNLTGLPVEVTPVCPAQINNTTCNGGTIPGVMKFHFTGSVNLGAASANWLFRFTGNMGPNNLAGRSNSMTNIIVGGGPAGGSVIVLEATLNNLSAPNSSVIYTTIPTPFFCLNLPSQFNPGAVDPNTDNLSFNLVDGITPQGLVNYISPYSATQPLGVQAGSFSFSTTTGQLGFTPNIVQTSLVVYKVSEYRNGLLVGTSMREMTFVVLNNCNNNAPVPNPISGLINGTQTGPFSVQICKGSPGNLGFNFTATDANGDNITITYAGLPTGATATINNNNSTNPQFNFSWNVTTVPYGTYTFYVTLKDNGCPLSSSQTYAYTVLVAPFGVVPATGFDPGCYNEHNASAWIQSQGTTAFDYIWRDAANQVVQQTNNSTTGDSLLNIDPGTYTVYLVNSFGCDTTLTITVPLPSYNADFSMPAVGCLNEAVAFQNLSTADIISWDWDFGDGGTSVLPNPAHTYTQPGGFTIRMIGATSKGCADTVFKTIQINEVIVTVSADPTICEGAAVAISASGASSYLWSPATGVWCPTCATTWVSPVDTITYTVTGTDAAGCKGTAQVTVNVLPTGLMVSPRDTGICPHDSLQLHVWHADHFRWEPITGLSDTGANPWIHPSGPLSYTVYAWYDNGCFDTATIKIRFLPDAVTYLEDSVTIYPGESYQIDPSGNCHYFQWWPSLGLSATNIQDPVAMPPVNTRYFLTATTEGGCVTTDSIDIFVSLESLLEVPNAFTPGGGVNNTIKVIKRGQADLKYFRIFNRWGNKVFETSNIDEGWDGQLKGHPQPMGVYVYLVEANTNTGHRFYKQGNITLIR